MDPTQARTDDVAPQQALPDLLNPAAPSNQPEVLPFIVMVHPPPAPGPPERRQRISAHILSWFLGKKTDAHLAGLDAIRGGAVLFVLLLHCWAYTTSPVMSFSIPLTPFSIEIGHVLGRMGIGVPMFFVLSGFLLSLPWHRAYYAGKPAPSIRTYLHRRLLRIVPPYWLMLILMLVLLTNSTIVWGVVVSPDGWKGVIASFLFLQQLFPVTSGGFGLVNTSIWTLTIEMTFYLVLPWFVRFFLGNRWRWSLPLCFAITLLYLYLVRNSLGPVVAYLRGSVAQYGWSDALTRQFLSWQFWSFLPEFGLGMALGNWWIYQQQKPLSRRLAAFTTPAMAVGYTAVGIELLAVTLYGYPIGNYIVTDWYLVNLVAALATGLLILGSLHAGRRLKACFGFLPLRLIGITGYSIYLWHLPIIHIVNNYPIFAASTPIQRFYGVTLLTLLLVALVGVALYLLVEKPLIERRPTLTNRQVSAGPPDSRPDIATPSRI